MNGEEIAFISDPAHIVKNIRNAFFNNIIYISKKQQEDEGLPTQEVNFDIIKKIVEFLEGKRELKIGSHLSRKTFKLNPWTKMDVARASHVFCWDTVQTIRFLCKNFPEQFPPYYLTTAYFIEMVSNWWDTMKSRSRKCSFTLKNLDEKVAELEKFMNFYGSMWISSIQAQSFWPTQKAVYLSTTSIIGMAKKFLKEECYMFFLPGRCLNDAVENFFSSVRSLGRLPTPLQYKRFCKAISITQYLKYSPNGSYGEDDSIAFLSDIEDFVKEEEEEYKAAEDLGEELDLFAKYDYDPEDFAEDCALANLAGCIMKGTIKARKCQVCLDAFTTPTDDDDQKVNEFIRQKEKENQKDKLVFPSPLGNAFFKNAELVFRSRRVDLLQISNSDMEKRLLNLVLRDIEEEYHAIEFPKCHLEAMFSKFLRARLNFWCGFSNEIMYEEQKKQIDDEANSSKTAAQMRATNSC